MKKPNEIIEKKKYKAIVQYIGENEDLDYPSDEFLEKIAPFIGFIVHSFNSLEQELNSRICFEICDDCDLMGLNIIYKESFSKKVNLYDRIIRSKQIGLEECYPSFQSIITNLRECSVLRNAVVHADWENMDSEGYTYVKLTLTNEKGWQQKYQQFTVKSLKSIDKLIHETYKELTEFEEEMYSVENKKPE